MAPTAYEPTPVAPAANLLSTNISDPVNSDSDDDENGFEGPSWTPMDSPEAVKTGRRYFFFQKFIRSDTGYVLNAHFEQFYKEKLRHFAVRDDDVYLITFPRSGTTWSQELVWCIANDLDLEGAKEPLIKRSPFLEYDALLPPGGLTRLPPVLRDLAEKAQAQGGSDPTKVYLPGTHLEFIDNCPSPRLIKTHLPLCLLPPDVRRKKCKVIYVARDARDVCVSTFHLFRGIVGYSGTLKEFVSNFLTGTCMWGPQWKHVLDHWQLRKEPNVLFLTYEEMKADLPSVIGRICKFLDKRLGPSGEALLADHVSFANMKANEAVSFDKNYEQVMERILKPVHDMGLSLDSLIDIAASGQLSRVPVGKALRLVVSGRVPLSLVSSVLSAKVHGRRVVLTADQVSRLTGGSLPRDMCDKIARITAGANNDKLKSGSSTPESDTSSDASERSGSSGNNNENSPTIPAKNGLTTPTKNNGGGDVDGSSKKKKNEKNGSPLKDGASEDKTVPIVGDRNDVTTTKTKENGRNKPSSSVFRSNFFRKGVVGNGKTELTDAQNDAFDEYDRKHFGGTGLSYGDRS